MTEKKSNAGDTAYPGDAPDGANGKLRDLQNAVRENPSSFEANRDLGATLLKNERYEEAFAHINRALELNPQYARGYAQLGTIFYFRGDMSKAEEYFNEALSHDYSLIDTHFNLAVNPAIQTVIVDAVIIIQRLNDTPANSRQIFSCPLFCFIFFVFH